jgi:Uncharacterized protein conserved in bacteria (DUF2252)
MLRRRIGTASGQRHHTSRLQGAALPMAADLATTAHSGLVVQLVRRCASGQLWWFRLPDREMLFDINDFDEQLEESIYQALRDYRRTLPGDRRRVLEAYRFVDLAREGVGVGSVGTRAWIVLFVGRDDDTLICK